MKHYITLYGTKATKGDEIYRHKFTLRLERSTAAEAKRLEINMAHEARQGIKNAIKREKRKLK